LTPGCRGHPLTGEAGSSAALLQEVDAAVHALRRGKGGGAASILMVHRTRELLVRQRTMVINAIRTHTGPKWHGA